jgi:methionyl aminopeptidase
MIVTTEEQLHALRKVGRAVAAAREAMLHAMQPGMTTRQLDGIGEQVLHDYGAQSAPRVMYQFPGGTCVSVNHCVAHGIPGDTVLVVGDVVNVDVSACLDGYYADTGATMVVGLSPTAHVAISPGTPYATTLDVLACSHKALDAAIAHARVGKKVSAIGRAVEKIAHQHGYTVIKNLTGHGIGTQLHEEPHYVYNYYVASENRLLRNGLVLAIEPFISTKSEVVSEAEDGWGLHVAEGIVAQFEHTVVITEGEAIVLTA